MKDRGTATVSLSEAAMSAYRYLRDVEEALKAHACFVERVGEASWDFALPNARAAPGRAELQDGWLTLTVPYGSIADAARAWDLLCAGGQLGGLARFVLRDRVAHVQAEIPLCEGSDVVLRCRQCLLRIHETLAAAQRDEDLSLPPDVVSDGQLINAGELLEEAGWAGFPRRPGLWAVELETGRGAYCQALLEPRAEGLRLWVELLRWTAPSRISAAALGAFLLTACGALRLVRAAGEDGEPVRARFEVCFETAPTPAELDRALGALSVACRMCAREALALEDPAIAATYLLMQGHWTEGGLHDG